MKTKIKQITFICVFLLASNTFAETISDENNVCKVSGDTVFAFFNGVQTTEDIAKKNLNNLKRVYGEKNSNDENIQYELMYNQTTGLDDFVETFEQRLLEQNIVLANRYELFFQALKGEGNWWNKIRDTVTGVKEIFASFLDLVKAEAIRSLTSWYGNPPTTQDYREHQTRIDNWILEGKKLLFVAHSQGNLFANAAYNYALPKTSTDSLNVVHIAPASPTTHGPHVLADQDLVINGLRLVGTVPPITDQIPMYNPLGNNYGRDFLGHGLIETYFNSNFVLRNKISGYINTALESLKSPPAQASSGFFTVTLTWDGSGDVDLHTFEPTGSHVYYRSLIGRSGYLDVDNIVAYGPEHYYASCDKTKLASGSYNIKLANYARAMGRVATVQVSSDAQGVLGTKSVVMGNETGDNPVFNMFTIVVEKNEETGKYTVSLN